LPRKRQRFVGAPLLVAQHPKKVNGVSVAGPVFQHALEGVLRAVRIIMPERVDSLQQQSLNR